MIAGFLSRVWTLHPKGWKHITLRVVSPSHYTAFPFPISAEASLTATRLPELHVVIEVMNRQEGQAVDSHGWKKRL